MTTVARRVLSAGIGIVVLAVTLWFGAVAAVGTMLAGPAPSVAQEQVSPDGRRKAAVLEVQGGATDGFMWKVAVTDARAGKFRNRDDVAVFKGAPGRIAWRGETLVVFQDGGELYLERSGRRHGLVEYVREP